MYAANFTIPRERVEIIDIAHLIMTYLIKYLCRETGGLKYATRHIEY